MYNARLAEELSNWMVNIDPARVTAEEHDETLHEYMTYSAVPVELVY